MSEAEIGFHFSSWATITTTRATSALMKEKPRSATGSESLSGIKAYSLSVLYHRM